MDHHVCLQGRVSHVDVGQTAEHTAFALSHLERCVSRARTHPSMQRREITRVNVHRQLLLLRFTDSQRTGGSELVCPAN
jgi:hypothetical protein